MNKVEREQAKYDALKAKLKEQEKKLVEAKEEYALLQEKKLQGTYDMLLDAIVLGKRFKIHHGMIAPYEHGYYVTGNDVKEEYCEPITCSAPWVELMPKKLYVYLKNHGWTEKEFKNLAKETKAGWRKLVKIYKYTKEKYVPSKSYLHGNYIATGYETDGFYHIVAGHCHGTYSSGTTSTQNELAQELVVLRGFCWDGLRSSSNFTDNFVSEFYNRHGLDGNKTDWEKRNSTRCMATSEYYADDIIRLC